MSCKKSSYQKDVFQVFFNSKEHMILLFSIHTFFALFLSHSLSFSSNKEKFRYWSKLGPRLVTKVSRVFNKTRIVFVQ